MDVRSATSRDVADIMRIRTSVTENALGVDQLSVLGITEESIAHMLATTHAGWCAEIEGRVIAFSMADREQATIFALFVHPAFEGRGAGTALLEAAVSYLASGGHQRITLSTDPETRAEAFYRAHGWQETGFNEQGEVKLALQLQ